jgi:hypothetical protein
VPDRASPRPTGQNDTPDLDPPRAEGIREIPQAPPPDLETGELLLADLRGIGSSLFVTTERLIISRDGRERRPRSGVQSFLLGTITHIRVERGAPASGRIAVWIGSQEVASMFFDARFSDRADETVEIARPAIARHRRLEAQERLIGS